MWGLIPMEHSVKQNWAKCHTSKYLHIPPGWERNFLTLPWHVHLEGRRLSSLMVHPHCSRVPTQSQEGSSCSLWTWAESTLGWGANHILDYSSCPSWVLIRMTVLSYWLTLSLTEIWKKKISTLHDSNFDMLGMCSTLPLLLQHLVL